MTIIQSTDCTTGIRICKNITIQDHSIFRQSNVSNDHGQINANAQASQNYMNKYSTNQLINHLSNTSESNTCSNLKIIIKQVYTVHKILI